MIRSAPAWPRSGSRSQTVAWTGPTCGKICGTSTFGHANEPTVFTVLQRRERAFRETWYNLRAVISPPKISSPAARSPTYFSAYRVVTLSLLGAGPRALARQPTQRLGSSFEVSNAEYALRIFPCSSSSSSSADSASATALPFSAALDDASGAGGAGGTHSTRVAWRT